MTKKTRISAKYLAASLLVCLSQVVNAIECPAGQSKQYIGDPDLTHHSIEGAAEACAMLISEVSYSAALTAADACASENPPSVNDTFQRTNVGADPVGTSGEFIVTYRRYRYGEQLSTSDYVIRILAFCISAECNTPAGEKVGLINLDFPADAPFVCAENCKATPYAGQIIGTKSGQGGRVEFGWSTGESCTTELEVPITDRKCAGTDPNICIDEAMPDHVIDGYIDNPDPVPDFVSGANDPTMEDSDTPGCVTVASGGVFCIAEAPPESRPDNGTPGTPATPDATADTFKPFGNQNASGSVGSSSGTYHYYTPGTVAGSTNQGSGGGECDPDTEECEGECDPETEECGPCDPETEECGEGEGGSCPEGQECGFTPPKEGAGFSDLSKPMLDGQIALAEEYADMREEMGELFSGVSEGSGSLPCTSFQFFGSSIPLCLTEYEDKLSILRQLIILIATLGAALLVLGAKN